MVLDSQTKPISLILQGQPGTQTIQARNSGYMTVETIAQLSDIQLVRLATPAN